MLTKKQNIDIVLKILVLPMFFYVFFMQPIHVIVEGNKEMTEVLEISEEIGEEIEEIYKYDLFYMSDFVLLPDFFLRNKVAKLLKTAFNPLFLEIFIPPPEL